MEKEIYLLGVGHNTQLYIELVELCGYKIAGLYHYNNKRVGETLLGYPIIDTNENLFKNTSLQGKLFAATMGDNHIRRELSNEIRSRGGTLPTLIHPSAFVSKYATIEDSVVIHANSVIDPGGRIEQDSVLSCSTFVNHDTAVGKACFLAPGAGVGAYIHIGDLAFIGQAAVLVSAKVKTVGTGAVIGAGAVVVSDVQEKGVVVGNPARLINVL